MGVGVSGDNEQKKANREAYRKNFQRGTIFCEERAEEGAHGHHNVSKGLQYRMGEGGDSEREGHDEVGRKGI